MDVKTVHVHRLHLFKLLEGCLPSLCSGQPPQQVSNRPVVEGMFRIIAQLELTEICCHAFLADAAECHEIASLHDQTDAYAQEPVSISTSAGTNRHMWEMALQTVQTQKLC